MERKLKAIIRGIGYIFIGIWLLAATIGMGGLTIAMWQYDPRFAVGFWAAAYVFMYGMYALARIADWAFDGDS